MAKAGDSEFFSVISHAARACDFLGESGTSSFLFGKPESRRMTVSVVLRNVGGRAVRVHTMEQTRGCPGDEDAQEEKSQLIASRGWGTGAVPGLLAAVSHVYLSPPLPRLKDSAL